MAKSKRLITVTAGRLVHAVCYSQALSNDSDKARAAKNNCSSLARQKLNFNTAYKKLQLELAANFNRHDLWVTLGFDDANLPPNRKAAKKIMAKFNERVRTRRRSGGEELKYAYSIHELQDDGSRRLHFHSVMNAGANAQDYEMIRSLWEWGDNIEIQQISDTSYYHNDDFLELAQYMLRERNPDAPVNAVGDRGWVPSRNLDKPVRESYLVDDNVTITAPPGAYIIDTDEKHNEYGDFRYITYLLKEEKPRPRPKRNRKKE
ncbi:MAG: hypothetical protein RR394_05265 [Oscillospiraceae bacterium]